MVAKGTTVHVHVPRTAGTTLKRFLGRCGYQIIDLDLTSNNFPSALDATSSPEQRRPALRLFGGHLRLDHAIFRKLDEPVTVITVLRDPVGRMLSNYNYTLRMPAAPWHDDVLSGRMTFIDNVQQTLKVYGPQFAYFDHTGNGDWRRTGSATPQVCLENLNARVTVVGFFDRLQEFVRILSRLLDLPITPLGRENAAADSPGPRGVPLKTALTAEEHSTLSTLLEDDIWFYEQTLATYLRGLEAPSSRSADECRHRV